MADNEVVPNEYPELGGKQREMYEEGKELFNSLDNLLKEKRNITQVTGTAVKRIFLDILALLAVACSEQPGSAAEGKDKARDQETLAEIVSMVREQRKILETLERKKPEAIKQAEALKPRKEQENTEKTVFVKPTQETGSANESKEKLFEELTEKNIKVNIKGIRPAGRNLVVDLESADEAKKLKKAIEESKHLKAEDFKKRNPKIIILGMDKRTNIEEFKTDIIDRNFLSTGILKDKLVKELKFKFPLSKKQGNTVNWVVELPSSLYWSAMKKGRLYANMHSFRVEDFCQPRRCNKCYMYGHVQRFCRNELATCRQCAEKGHTAENCQQKQGKTKCSNCIRANGGETTPTCYHYVKDRSCPEYIRALRRERKETDYTKVETKN